MKDKEQASRTLVLIDGSHVDRLRTKLGRSIDIEKLAEFFGSEEEPATVIYYRDARDMAEYTRLRPFFDWLARHGFQVRGAQNFAEPWYQRERYGTNLVQLAIDAIEAAHQGEALAVVAGDAKLIPLFQRVDEMELPLTLISSLSVPASIAPPPPLVELADVFIDLDVEDIFFQTVD
ncbi:NYN domain-containing protein [Yoonia sp.]|uniref:NYN domain-containing protein n=1 Tax=Yoonia sp. TaxID=2212373 RepID=UPI00391AB919